MPHDLSFFPALLNLSTLIKPFLSYIIQELILKMSTTGNAKSKCHIITVLLNTLVFLTPTKTLKLFTARKLLSIVDSELAKVTWDSVASQFSTPQKEGYKKNYFEVSSLHTTKLEPIFQNDISSSGTALMHIYAALGILAYLCDDQPLYGLVLSGKIRLPSSGGMS
jgi:hypothetical protein